MISSPGVGLQHLAMAVSRPFTPSTLTASVETDSLEAGTAKLVGTDKDVIIKQAQELLSDKKAYLNMATKANPYGDGKSAKRIVDILLERVR